MLTVQALLKSVSLDFTCRAELTLTQYDQVHKPQAFEASSETCEHGVKSPESLYYCRYI